MDGLCSTHEKKNANKSWKDDTTLGGGDLTGWVILILIIKKQDVRT